MNKKVGIWIVLILTSLALVIPSIAIVYSLLTESSNSATPITINSDDVKISVQTAAPVSTADSLPEASSIPVIDSSL